MSAQDTLGRAHGTVAEWMSTSKIFDERQSERESYIEIAIQRHIF